MQDATRARARMDELAQQLEAANRVYYASAEVGSASGLVMSDAEYDALFDELKRLEARWPHEASTLFTADRPSPTQQVGYRPLAEVRVVLHGIKHDRTPHTDLMWR
jgi:DNA ligase (NAD+)